MKKNEKNLLLHLLNLLNNIGDKQNPLEIDFHRHLQHS